MNASLKCKLLVAPLLASAVCARAAAPIALDDAAMDRLTAGALPTFEQILTILAAAPRNPAGSGFATMQPMTAEQLASLEGLTGPIGFRVLGPGELVAAQELRTGAPILIVRQLSGPEAASLGALKVGDAVAASSISPGVPTHFQQISHGGTNYLYVYSTGSSSITTLQKSGF